MADEPDRIIRIFHVDVKDDDTELQITLGHQSGNVSILVMDQNAAMRLSKVLNLIREERGWRHPDEPIKTDKLQ